MRWRWLLAVSFAASGLLACGDIVDWLAGEYQPHDQSGAPTQPYLIIEAAPDSAQPTNPSLGTLVYIQASGGQQIAIRTLNGSFAVLQSEAGSPGACLPVPPNLTAVAVQPAPASETILLVDLLEQDDAGVPEAGGDASDAGPLDAASDSSATADAFDGSDAGDAGSATDASQASDAAATMEPEGDEPLSCTLGYHPILSAAAVITDTRVIVLDSGISDAGDAGDAGAADGGDGGPTEDGSPDSAPITDGATEGP